MTSLSRDLPSGVRDRNNVVWVGALSFEERCLGSLQTLIRVGAKIKNAFALDYRTRLRPRSLGEQNRSFHKKRMLTFLGDRLRFERIHPYRYTEFLRLMAEIEDEVAGNRDTHVVYDISCITKVHAVALAYFLKVGARLSPSTVCYSIPEAYGSSSRDIWGRGQWRSVLTLRLDLDSTHRHSGSDAVAILGHEGDRMRLALHEVDAQTGLLLKVTEGDQDCQDFGAVCEIQNARLIVDYGKGLMPGFEFHTIGLLDPRPLHDYVTEVARSAKASGRRLVLCPFGPKPSVFHSAMAALDAFFEGTWICYPVPVSYDAEYSIGYEKTYWQQQSWWSPTQLRLFGGK